MASDLVKAFVESMVIDYERWHDGIGYQIDLLPQMSDAERLEVENLLLQRGVQDWRDLEALDAMGTPRAIELILITRKRGTAELQIFAQRYGPQPSTKEREAAVIEGLANTDFYGGLTETLDMAVELDTPRVRAALLRVARDRTEAAPYHAVATLFAMSDLASSRWDDTHRQFYLRFSGPLGPERDAAYAELCAKLGVDPSFAGD